MVVETRRVTTPRPWVAQSPDDGVSERRPEVAAISEALWEEAQPYGHRIAADEQLAVARAVWAARSFPRASDVTDAYERFGLRKPPAGYAVAVIRRLERLAR